MDTGRVDAQETPLLRTKLYIPPLRREQVSRPRLLDQLDAGLDRKLTLVSAPAGFGKTTLVSEWIASHRRGGPRSERRGVSTLPDGGETAVPRPGGQASVSLHVGWLSLDEGDNDLTRFLAYLIAALQAALQEVVETQIGQGVLGALRSPQPPPVEVVLTALVNEIAAHSAGARLILVLDDYHLIEAQPVQDALTFLLRHQPPGVHLVLATREDPPLPLARLRAQGQLSELRASDLRFTPAEAAEFLNSAMGLDLSAQDITALESRTEGWVAGLQLAALALQGALALQASRPGRKDTTGFIQSFSGSHHFVLDYLLEEVLEQQPECIQDFLLRTAVLDRLTGPLCDALTDHARTGQGDGRATLEKLDHANLFIVPLDDERHWYRYHRLFADLLRQRLRLTQPERVPALHLRAIEWYEGNGFTDEAIEHALRAQQFERAADLIESVAEATWGREQHTKSRPWLAKLPMETLSSRPHLCVFHAGYLFVSGQQDEAERHLQSAALAAAGRADHNKLLGRIEATRSFMASYRSDAPGVIPHALRALEYLPEQDITWRGAAAIALGDAYVYQGQYAKAEQTYQAALETIGATSNTYLWMNVSLKLALVVKSRGRLQQVIEICQQRLQLARESGMSQTEMVGWLLAIWGEVLAELDDLDGALEQVNQGIELTEQGRDVAMLTWSYLCLTRVLFSRGELAAAQETITETENMARASTVPLWVTNMMAAWQVRVWLAQGRLHEALEWVHQRGLDPETEPTYVGALEYIALARILIAQERYDDATRLLDRLLQPADAGSHTTRAVEILMLQALVFQAEGESARAMASLERALTLAEPGGLVRIFVDEGPPMANLLYSALKRGIAARDTAARDTAGHDIVARYARRLLAAFPTAEPGQPAEPKTQAPESRLIEPLSERELEVLHLIAEGLTNPEIAARLYLSPNTVKAHTRNIYGKLSVHNRTQAVARARGLGLLSSP